MNRYSTTARIPTVDDLRVKFCYICQDEELYSAPEDPPRAWTHPCTCTLVAHESCLLHWIQTSQADPERADKALKCPQCGTKYELVSKKPYILGLIGVGNRILQRAGRTVTLVGAAGIVGVFASGIYAVATVYGGWAVKQFIGKEMYDLLLTDDPANWRWTTFINLPSIPFALILSRFQTPRLIPSIVPILLLWPPIPPVHVSEVLSSKASPPFSPSSFLSADLRISRPLSTILWSWPPTPALFGLLLVPIVRFTYRKMWKRLQIFVLGAAPPFTRRTSGNSFVFDGWPFPIHINGEANFIDHRERQEQVGQRPARDQQEFGEELGAGEERQEAQPQDAIPQNALEAAARTIAVMRSSLGRRVGGALLIPWISARMGALLLAASKHWAFLRRILGMRPPLPDVLALVPGPMQETGLVGRVQRTLGTVWRSTMRGSTTWAEADPVWWRNAIGFGLFVVAKDTVELLHLWLATRELESRHVKNRDFTGIDIGELDLVPEFLRSVPPTVRPQVQQRAQSLPRGL